MNLHGQRIEIARSYSRKKNIGNYESIDFFASAKGDCYAEEADEFSGLLYQFSRQQVLKAMKEEFEPAAQV